MQENKNNLSKEEREIEERARIAMSMPDNIAHALKNAVSKPEWCSDTRWRMELGRRRLNRHNRKCFGV